MDRLKQFLIEARKDWWVLGLLLVVLVVHVTSEYRAFMAVHQGGFAPVTLDERSPYVPMTAGGPKANPDDIRHGPARPGPLDPVPLRPQGGAEQPNG